MAYPNWVRLLRFIIFLKITNLKMTLRRASCVQTVAPIVPRMPDHWARRLPVGTARSIIMYRGITFILA